MKLMPRMLDDHSRDRRARVECWLERRTEAEAAAAVCEGWIEDLMACGRTLCSGEDINLLPAHLSLLNRLSTAKLDCLSVALVWQIDTGVGEEPDEAALIGHALAAASGRAYAAHGPDKLEWIGSFVASIYGPLWEDFARSAAETLARYPSALEAYIHFLASIITKAKEAPDTVTQFPPMYGSMASLVEKFLQTGSFQEVWEAHQCPYLFESTGDFEILRRANAKSFVKLIDQLPHPTIVQQCLGARALVESPGDALILLRLANPAFDAEGRWQRSGMAAILLLQLVGEQLIPRQSDEGDAEDLSESVELFRKMVDQVLDVLFARSDHVELAWHWLENVLRKTPQLRPSEHQGVLRKQIVDRIGILAHALSSRMTPRDDQDAWIAQAEPLARQFRAVAVLCVAGFTTAVADLNVGLIAIGLIKGDGFELTGASNLIQEPQAPMRTLPGHVLARLPTVAAWFISTWSALRFERERAWQFKRHRGGNPAETMALWGLSTIESLVTDAEARPRDVADMWLATESVFREARLVEPRLGQDFWSLAIARLFRLWPRIFMVSRDQTDRSHDVSLSTARLSKALAPYVEISADFMAVIGSLRQAELASSMLDDAVGDAGHDLLRMIRLFIATARQLNAPRLWNPDSVAMLRKVEAEITRCRRKPGLETAVNGPPQSTA